MSRDGSGPTQCCFLTAAQLERPLPHALTAEAQVGVHKRDAQGPATGGGARHFLRRAKTTANCVQSEKPISLPFLFLASGRAFPLHATSSNGRRDCHVSVAHAAGAVRVAWTRGRGRGAEGPWELGGAAPLSCRRRGGAGTHPSCAFVCSSICGCVKRRFDTQNPPPLLPHSGAFVTAVPSTAPRRPLPTYIAAHDTAPPGELVGRCVVRCDHQTTSPQASPFSFHTPFPSPSRPNHCH